MGMDLYPDKTKTLHDRASALEELCALAHLNYYPLEIQRADSKALDHYVLVGKYQVHNTRTDYKPVYALSVRGETEITLTTGVWHDTWAFPLFTADMEVRIYKCTPEDELQAFFTRLAMLPTVHKERMRRMNQMMPESTCNDLFMNLIRDLRYKGPTLSGFLRLLPVRGERVTPVEIFGLLTARCRHRNPFVRGNMFGTYADHLIQNLDPLHQHGKRVIFRLGGAI